MNLKKKKREFQCLKIKKCATFATLRRISKNKIYYGNKKIAESRS